MKNFEKEKEKENEVLWESPEKTPNGDPYMKIKKSRGYYYYAERGGIDSIAFVLIDKNNEKPYGLIYESKPPLDEIYKEKHMRITAFGGSIDMGDTKLEEICKIEVLEEAGYNIGLDKERINLVGGTMVSTQMNQICYGFAVDVTDLISGKTEADYKNEVQILKDPDEFIHNKVIWMNKKELLSNDDWKSIWIVCKYEMF